MTTRKQYVTINEIEAYADVDLKSAEGAEQEAYNWISQAEDMIDNYVRRQSKHIPSEYLGDATSGTTTKIFDIGSDTPLYYADDYFKYCEVEMLSGSNAGEIRPILSSNYSEKSVTVSYAFTNAVAEGDVFIIRQQSKFPRICDVKIYNQKYYKTIPVNVREAVKAQVQYMIEQGKEFFINVVDQQSESIDDYSHNLKEFTNNMIAPKARELLKGIRDIKGNLIG